MMRKKFSLRNGLTIEYTMIMMALVAAFSALILTSATATTDHSADYRIYLERKAVVDELGDAYIQKYVYGDQSVNLKEILLNDENKEQNALSFDESSTELTVRRGSIIELCVVLGKNTDGKTVVVRYVYGTY